MSDVVNCELSSVCPALSFENAAMDNSTTTARNNVTFICNSGFKFADGKSSTVRQCQMDGKWNASVQDCIPSPYVTHFSDLTLSTDVLFDQNLTSCQNVTVTKPVYSSAIRKTSVTVIGPNITCGHMMVATAFDSLMYCPLEGAGVLGNLTSCKYRCQPGYGIAVRVLDSIICEIYLD